MDPSRGSNASPVKIQGSPDSRSYERKPAASSEDAHNDTKKLTGNVEGPNDYVEDSSSVGDSSYSVARSGLLEAEEKVRSSGGTLLVRRSATSGQPSGIENAGDGDGNDDEDYGDSDYVVDPGSSTTSLSSMTRSILTAAEETNRSVGGSRVVSGANDDGGETDDDYHVQTHSRQVPQRRRGPNGDTTSHRHENGRETDERQVPMTRERVDERLPDRMCQDGNNNPGNISSPSEAVRNGLNAAEEKIRSTGGTLLTPVPRKMTSGANTKDERDTPSSVQSACSLSADEIIRLTGGSTRQLLAPPLTDTNDDNNNTDAGTNTSPAKSSLEAAEEKVRSTGGVRLAGPYDNVKRRDDDNNNNMEAGSSSSPRRSLIAAEDKIRSTGGTLLSSPRNSHDTLDNNNNNRDNNATTGSGASSSAAPRGLHSRVAALEQKIRSTGGTRLVPMSPGLQRSPSTRIMPSDNDANNRASRPVAAAPPIAPPMDFATDGAIPEDQGAQEKLAATNPMRANRMQQSRRALNSLDESMRSLASQGVPLGKTRVSRRGAGQRRTRSGETPPPPPPATPPGTSRSISMSGEIMLDMASNRSLSTTPGDRAAASGVAASSSASRRAAFERKQQELDAMRRETDANTGSNNRRGNAARGGGLSLGQFSSVPGAYSVEGPGDRRGRQASNRRPPAPPGVASASYSSNSSDSVGSSSAGSSGVAVAARPRLSMRSASSSRLLVNAVLVEEENEDDEGRGITERERRLAEQERQMAEQQARLAAWEQELERKKRELELLSAPGAIVQAEIIEDSKPAAKPKGIRRIFSGASSGDSYSGNSGSQKELGDDATVSCDFHLPLTPAYTQEDSARSDAIDYMRAFVELGEGPMRFSGQNERSFDAQVAEMSKNNKRVLKRLLQRWEDFRAKKHAHALSKEWILRFARVTASLKNGEFKEQNAWKAMRKLKKRYTLLSAHSLEEQLLSKTLFPIPGLKTIDGQEMFYMKPARYFPRETRTRDIIDNLNYAINTMLEREHPCTHGIGFCANMNDWEWKNFEVNYCLQFMLTLQSFNVPVKVELFLIVNPPSWFGAIWKIMKPMLAPSFRKKVKVILRDKLPKYLAPGFEEFLPDEMEGGKANTEELVQDFVTYRKYYEWKLGGAHYYEAPASASASVRSGSNSGDVESQGSDSTSMRNLQMYGNNSIAAGSTGQISALSFEDESVYGSIRSGEESTERENEDDDASIDDDLSLFSDVGWHDD